MIKPRTIVLGLGCILAVAATPASAHEDKGYGWMPHHRGHMSMMGPGHGWTMNPGCGWTMGHGHGWMGRPGGGAGMGPGWMMGPGAGWGMHGGATDPERLSDERLDQIGERIAERYRDMQQIASEQDPSARRELVRQHLESMQKYRWSDRWNADGDNQPGVSGRGYRRGGMMGPGTMGPGMMGPGMMGPGTMGPGMMGPGMMGPGTSGPGMMGPGTSGPGMMGPGTSGRGMMDQRLDDEQLDRMAEYMAENYKRMQELAETADEAKRRELMREHFELMSRYRGGMY